MFEKLIDLITGRQSREPGVAGSTRARHFNGGYYVVEYHNGSRWCEFLDPILWRGRDPDHYNKGSRNQPYLASSFAEAQAKAEEISKWGLEKIRKHNQEELAKGDARNEERLKALNERNSKQVVFKPKA